MLRKISAWARPLYCGKQTPHPTHWRKRQLWKLACPHKTGTNRYVRHSPALYLPVRESQLRGRACSRCLLEQLVREPERFRHGQQRGQQKQLRCTQRRHKNRNRRRTKQEAPNDGSSTDSARNSRRHPPRAGVTARTMPNLPYTPPPKFGHEIIERLEAHISEAQLGGGCIYHSGGDRGLSHCAWDPRTGTPSDGQFYP